MYTLQSFVTLDREVDNVPNSIAPFGELSTKARTYALDITEHRDDAIADLALNIFSSRQDDTTVAIRPTVLESMFTLVDYVHTRGQTGMNTGESENLLANIENDFPGVFASVVVGDMVSNGTYWMPSFIIATVLGQQEDTRIRIFFSNDAFLQRYDQSYIQPIHPVDNLDDLHTSIANIKLLTKNLDIPTFFDRVNEHVDLPDTLTRAFQFAVVNPSNPDEKVVLPWAVAIYGQAGNNIDAIYAELRKDILENSSYPVEDWEERIPDLFKTVEFTIVPFWDQYSVPNQAVDGALYSPMVPLNDAVATLDIHMPLYPSEHVQTNAEVSWYMFKSIAFGICGGPENRNEVYDLRTVHADYAAISTVSNDFNRLTPETRGLIMRLAEQLSLAETVGEFTVLPDLYNKTWRGNRLYVTSTYMNVQYYVLAKNSFTGNGSTPDPDPDPIDPPVEPDPVDPPANQELFITQLDDGVVDATIEEMVDDGSNLYTLGHSATLDAVILSKFSNGGDKVWSKSLTTTDAFDGWGLTFADGELYVAYSSAVFPGQGILAVFDTDGTLTSQQQLTQGNANVGLVGVAVADNKVFTVGTIS